MKKIITLAAFVFLIGKVYAQSSFAPVNTIWDYYVGTMSGPSSYTVKVIKDTTVNGLTYKKLEKFDKLTQSTSTTYLLNRRDSIYFSDDLIYNKLLYAFNLTVNQTMQTYNLSTLKVDSIKTLNIAGADRKVFYLKMTCPNNTVKRRITLIENIGPVECPVTWTNTLCDPDNLEPPYYRLDCFNNTQNSYPTDCKLSTVISKSPNLTFNIFPNPADNQLEITSESVFDKIEIYNSQGVLVHSKEQLAMFGMKLLLNSNEFQSGIYIIKFHINGSHVGTEKISIKH